MRFHLILPPHPGHQQAASSVIYTSSCKHSLVLLRMGEIIARNMLSWLKLLIKLLLLHLIGCLYYRNNLYLRIFWVSCLMILHLWFGSDIFITSLYTFHVFNLFTLHPWRWPHHWPQHIAVNFVCKLISVYVCIFVGTDIVRIYANDAPIVVHVQLENGPSLNKAVSYSCSYHN